MFNLISCTCRTHGTNPKVPTNTNCDTIRVMNNKMEKSFQQPLSNLFFNLYKIFNLTPSYYMQQQIYLILKTMNSRAMTR